MGDSNDLGLFGRLNAEIQSQKLEENQQITIKVKKSIFGGTRFVHQVVDLDKIKPKKLTEQEIEKFTKTEGRQPTEEEVKEFSKNKGEAEAKKKSKQISYRELLKGASHQSENDKIDENIYRQIKQLSNRVITPKDIQILADLEKKAVNVQNSSRTQEGLARLKGKITTPTRYLGSKTWSLPGRALILPLALPALAVEGTRKLGNTLLSVFKSDTSVKVANPPAYYSFKKPEQLTPEKAKEAIPDMAIAQYAYENNFSDLSHEQLRIPSFNSGLIKGEKLAESNFSFNSIENSELANNIPGNIETRTGGVFYDQTTGFKCCVCENANNPSEIVVGFSCAANTEDPEVLNAFLEIYVPDVPLETLTNQGKSDLINFYNQEKSNFLTRYYQKNIQDQEAINQIYQPFTTELSTLVSQKNFLLVIDEDGALNNKPTKINLPQTKNGGFSSEALIEFKNKYPVVYNALLEKNDLTSLTDETIQIEKLIQLLPNPTAFSDNLKEVLDGLNQKNLNLLAASPFATRETTLSTIKAHFESQKALNTTALKKIDNLEVKLDEMNQSIFDLAKKEGLDQTAVAQRLQLDIKQENFINNSFSAYQMEIGKKQLLGKGNTPKACVQADAFVQNVMKAYPDKTIKLTGFCFGGMLAQYAALKNEVPASCFNSLQLGPKLQQDIGSEKLEKAGSYVEHFSIERDHITDSRIDSIVEFKLPKNLESLRLTPLDNIVNKLGIRTPGNFGKTYQTKLPENILDMQGQKPDPHADVMLGLMNTANMLNIPPPEEATAA
jgi:predicted esterase YcpF (UPF0227 family)